MSSFLKILIYFLSDLIIFLYDIYDDNAVENYLLYLMI